MLNFRFSILFFILLIHISIADNSNGNNNNNNNNGNTNNTQNQLIDYYRNISAIVNGLSFDTNSSFNVTPIVRKVDDKYRYMSDDALIQYLLSQVDELVNDVGSVSCVTEYNFTIRIELILESDFILKITNKINLSESAKNDDNLYIKVINAYFTEIFLQRYGLKGLLIDNYSTSVNRSIRFNKTHDCLAQIYVPLSMQESNVQRLNTRVAGLLRIIADLLKTNDFPLFSFAKHTFISKIALYNKMLNVTSNEENTFCSLDQSFDDNGFDAIPYTIQKMNFDFNSFVNTGFINYSIGTQHNDRVDQNRYLFRLNSYNLPKNTNVQLEFDERYEYEILFYSNFTITNNLNLKLCYKPLIIYSTIFYQNQNLMFCNLTTSDLYYLTDRDILVGLHTINNHLFFTPFNFTNSTFIDVVTESARQIDYRSHLICLDKTTSDQYVSQLFALNQAIYGTKPYSSTTPSSSTSSIFENSILFQFSSIINWFTHLFS